MYISSLSEVAATREGHCIGHDSAGREHCRVEISSSSESDGSSAEEQTRHGDGMLADATAYWALVVVRKAQSDKSQPCGFSDLVVQRRRQHTDHVRFAADVVKRLERALRRLRSVSRRAHAASADAAR